MEVPTITRVTRKHYHASDLMVLSSNAGTNTLDCFTSQQEPENKGFSESGADKHLCMISRKQRHASLIIVCYILASLLGTMAMTGSSNTVVHYACYRQGSQWPTVRELHLCSAPPESTRTGASLLTCWTSGKPLSSTAAASNLIPGRLGTRS